MAILSARVRACPKRKERVTWHAATAAGGPCPLIEVVSDLAAERSRNLTSRQMGYAWKERSCPGWVTIPYPPDRIVGGQIRGWENSPR